MTTHPEIPGMETTPEDRNYLRSGIDRDLNNVVQSVIRDLDRALDYAGKLEAEKARLKAALAEARMQEWDWFRSTLQRRRGGSYNDWITKDEELLIDVLLADVAARALSHKDETNERS